MRLADTSPSITALGRCAFALPLLLIQPAGSVALSFAFLGERPSALQLLGVVLVLTGVVVAVGGNAPQARGSGAGRGAGYSRRRTKIIRHATAASTGESASKSP
jgi:hypothetical protein